MDHIKFGKQLKHYINPPAIPTDEDIQTFSSGLKVVIEEKLSELNSRDFYITSRNEARLRRIQKLTKSGSPEEWFCLEYAAGEYEEHFYIIKWKTYWLHVHDRLNGKRLKPNSNSLNIAKAKQVPIENLYTGNLRKFGNKLCGLCPFHEEKSPSFFIYTDTNTFCCYGCNEQGDVITFKMKLENHEFKEAVRSLQ